jgi:hypothetical protein
MIRQYFVLKGALIRHDHQLLRVVLMLLFLSSSVFAQNDMRYFITRSSDQLMEGDKPYRSRSYDN